MASTQEFADFVIQQFDPHCGATHKKMFGEYGLFSAGKMFAMVCDDRLLFKPTVGGRAWIGTVVEALPYPGAKPCFLIEDRIEDREWLSELARITTRELPPPKAKKPKPKQ
ncbi:MAG: TfoX/Sxy family protein [Gemmatimonadota bacterium]|nr:TfoX/Sxy family protein [Gemmatimonadota bacterium]